MMSFHWFMPAFVNISVGSSFITMGADGTMVCPFEAKNCLNDSLISLAVIKFDFLVFVCKVTAFSLTLQ